LKEGVLVRKRHHEEDDEIMDDDELEGKEDDDEDEEDDEEDDEDTIDLDQAEEEEDDDDLEDEDEKGLGRSVDDIERRRIFQNEAEEVLEGLTLEDIREVLKENDQDESLAPRLKRILAEVVNEGEASSMEEVWEEALGRLEE
jgi:hypothetical protein